MKTRSDTNDITRRDALKSALLAPAALALFDPRRTGAETTSARPNAKPPAPAAASRPNAKSVIQIWMWGGPSHLDTFDPKPDAGYDYCGPLGKAIPTNVDGIQINAELPLLAQHADKYVIIRSMTHGINAHETASYRVQTGRDPGRLVFPSVGAVVGLLRGYDHGYQGLVPPYIVLTEPQGRFSEAGLLGPKYKPFATGGDPNKDPFVVEGIIAKGVSDERQLNRRQLLSGLDTLANAMPSYPLFKQLEQCEKNAYDMMFGDARKLFDLATEQDQLRERYGRNTFGQSCLMARRLVEHGVPYVTINYKGWDTHKQHFEIMKRKLPEMDRAMAALLQDLHDRSLLETTIVWWGGEFGRGPKVQWEPPWNGGRSHYGKCFSVVVAGGGFQTGRVVGASDKVGAEVAQRPVRPEDLIAAMYERLGIDPDGPLPNPRGLDLQIMPLSKTGPGGRLEEIL